MFKKGRKLISMILSLIMIISFVCLALPVKVYAAELKRIGDYKNYFKVGSSRGSEALIVVSLDGKFGFIDKTGKEIVAPKYDDFLGFSKGFCGVKLGNKWGLIDETGKEIVKPKYDNMLSVSEEEGLYKVKLGDKWGLINIIGKEVVPIRYKYISNFEDGIAIVRASGKIYDFGDKTVEYGGKYGLIDKTGKEILTPKYDSIGGWNSAFNSYNIFSEGLAVVKIVEKYTPASSSGYMYEENVKYGYIDKTGKEVIPLKYDGAYNYSDGLAKVIIYENGTFVENSSTFIDKNGIEVAELTTVNRGTTSINAITGKKFVIDKTGKETEVSKYDYIYYLSESMFGVISYVEGNTEKLEDGSIKIEMVPKYGIIDNTEKEIVKPKYDLIDNFSEGLAHVAYDVKFNEDYEIIGGKHGFVDKNGKEVVPLIYDHVKNFSDGLSVVGIDGKFGLIDKTGKIIVPIKYDLELNNETDNQLFFFLNDLAPVKLNNKYGLIDRTGKEIVSPKYDQLHRNFSDGFVLVSIMGNDEKLKYGFIDKTGKEVIPVQYTVAAQLSDNLFVLSEPNGNGLYTLLSETPEQKQDLTAIPSPSKVLVNGIETAINAYNIKGSNYFKLRDLAVIINGTNKQFDIGYDNVTNAVTITSEKSYVNVGGEMAKGDGKIKTPLASTSTFLFNGTKVEIKSYLIDGSNYVNLRDVMKLVNINVGYNEATKAISLDTNKDY